MRHRSLRRRINQYTLKPPPRATLLGSLAAYATGVAAFLLPRRR